MRAVLFHGEGQVTVGELPDPTLAPGKAMVRVTRAALCGSELGMLRAPRSTPVGTGHEAIGVVSDPGDTGLTVGQRVALLAVLGCGECVPCREGRFPHCARATGMPPSHAEFVAMPGPNCLPLPNDLDDDVAIAVFGCGIGVAYHGCRRVGAQPGETVLVVGAGPIGLSAVLVLKQLGARPVVADVNPYRRELAAALGASACLAADVPEFTEALRAANGGRLADRAFLASGNPAACALALSNIEPEGAIATVGGVGEFPLNTFAHLSVRDRALIGSWHYHRAEFDPLVQMVRGGLPAEKIITHRFLLEEAPEAYRLFAAGKTGKTLLCM